MIGCAALQICFTLRISREDKLGLEKLTFMSISDSMFFSGLCSGTAAFGDRCEILITGMMKAFG